MPVHAILGIENDALNTAVSLLLLVLLAIWLALVVWTYKDAVRRIGDSSLVATSVATSLIFPFIGTVVYLILRPPEFLEDMRERELEIAAAEARLVQSRETGCPHCGYPVERSFLLCPSCLARLRQPCTTCRKPIDPNWRICPYCEAEVGQAQPRRRRRVAGGAERARTPAGARAADPAAAQPPQPTTRRQAAAAEQQATAQHQAVAPEQSPGATGTPAPDGDGVAADESTIVRRRPSAR